MKIEEGKVFGFIGPNGAGKTTTIKLLTGILSPDSGRVMLNGIDMARDPIAAKRSFGYVPDSFDMYERLTGMDYLNFMADIYGWTLQAASATLKNTCRCLSWRTPPTSRSAATPAA